jgi:HTH-type transcriptional regulator, competence development regulator
MTVGKETFGACIRRERESRRLGLRQMAKKIGVSPTYLSKVERDEFTPPTEEKVRAIARFIERDPDELLAMAGRVSSDILEIIKHHPMELSTFLRSLSDEDIGRLRHTAQDALEVLEAKARRNWIKDGR